MSTHADPDGGLAESDIFHILGNDRRREILSVLAAEEGRLAVSDIAQTVAAREAATDDSVPNNLYKSVYVSLQQTHLPQLEADGIVVYDTDAKTIQPGPHFDRVRMHIDESNALATTALHATIALSLGGLALVTLSVLGAPLVTRVPPISLASLALALVAVGGGVAVAADGSLPALPFRER
ncbi:hypothetical protein Halru_1602 [Halovivax ruber XH-70]|uniref:DUF7344 domain-containing protein n=1 Tax=Halovivax ruber (strain DSM 18193 / JCM 13892 / XH-70) TaxID=797302 RepID=L0IBR8_HALRX|nr:hypothetical protein [Halovivax ruber]AGB16209.1 hypothetical protein Halru_1602 [Halovivax ruber XH-70]